MSESPVEIRVRHNDLAVLASEASPHEAAAAAHLAHPRRQEWLTGRILARRAAADVLGCEPSDVVIDVTGDGAPVVVGDDGVCVSISHTRDLVVAGAVRGPWLGVDVEWADRDVSRLERALSTDEMTWAITAGVVTLLVAKEAAAKSWGVGLGGSLCRWPVEDVGDGYVQVGSPAGQVRAVGIRDLVAGGAGRRAVMGVCADGFSVISVSD